MQSIEAAKHVITCKRKHLRKKLSTETLTAAKAHQNLLTSALFVTLAVTLAVLILFTYFFILCLCGKMMLMLQQKLSRTFFQRDSVTSCVITKQKATFYAMTQQIWVFNEFDGRSTEYNEV